MQHSTRWRGLDTPPHLAPSYRIPAAKGELERHRLEPFVRACFGQPGESFAKVCLLFVLSIGIIIFSVGYRKERSLAHKPPVFLSLSGWRMVPSRGVSSDDGADKQRDDLGDGCS